MSFHRLVAAALLFAVPVSAAQPPVVVPPAPDGGPADPELERIIGEIDAELDRRRDEDVGAEEVSPFPPGWPDLESLADQPPIRTLVHPPDRSVRVVTTTLRHTMIQLPYGERIVDYVVGDALYFDLRGAHNVAYLKAMADDRRTQVSLVTASDRAYSFDVFSTVHIRPDEVIRVEWDEAHDTSLLGPPGVAATPVALSSVQTTESGLVAGFNQAFQLDFVPAGRVVSLERQLDQVFADVADIEADASRQLARVEDLAAQRVDDFLDTYPRRVLPRYRLSPEIQMPPLFVQQIWTDGRFTYLRSTAAESPAIYTLSGREGEEPVLVNVDLTPEGLYVIDHVVGAGFAQLHGSRGEWHLWEIPPLSLLPEILEQGLPLEGPPPDWVRTRSTRNWVQRHPKLFGTLVAGAVGGFFTVRAIW